MNSTLIIPQNIFNEIQAVTQLPVETAGVLLVSIVPTSNGDKKILARKIQWLPEDAYLKRTEDSLSIASDGYVPFLAEAEKIGATPIWLHTHPGINSIPKPSKYDKEVDRKISDLFQLRSNSPYYGTLIFSPRENSVAFTGYIEEYNGPRSSIEKMFSIGDRFRLISAFDVPSSVIPPIFDRNVRALGGDVQRTLSNLKIAVVGCGGTGSAVTEQLARLGVRNFVLFDPDEISESNLTRVYGSGVDDVGKFKCDVLASHLKRISPDIKCDLIRSMITERYIAEKLSECDVIFGCTDDNAGRLILSRLSTYFLIPVIDCGILITNDDKGYITGINGRVTTLVPGQACLVCRGRIDLLRAGTELLTPDERNRREDEGYAPSLGRIEPAVVNFTTIVAASAVTELIERLIGYGPHPPPSEVLLRCHDREISTNICAPGKGHYCDPCSGKLGIGLTIPFLEQTWQN